MLKNYFKIFNNHGQPNENESNSLFVKAIRKNIFFPIAM